MISTEKRIIQWLRDAHGMEEQAQTMFQAEANRIRNYPEFHEKIEEARQRSRRQAERISSCIERHSSTTSMVKDTIGRVIALGQGLSGSFVGDEVIKAALAIYTFEHMKIGSYTILAFTAQQAGDAQTEKICREIVGEEEQMAEWIAQHMQVLVERYLRLEDTPGAIAKH